ncbi:MULTISPECIES: YeaC family protein [unclassified Endozoicomonas]|uniref:YeaC family protein n=1 Tax=unclassified Endozoicomonas TaxID=2644528 RepID=UPI0021479FB4|nr:MULTISPECIES: YeaC family protein [unclassified Endozoicomonas]
MQLKDFLARMTPEIYHNMKQSLELGRWPNGDMLTADQREGILEALIAWEHDNLPEEERIGYMPVSCKSASEQDESETTILRFKD